MHSSAYTKRVLSRSQVVGVPLVLTLLFGAILALACHRCLVEIKKDFEGLVGL